MLHRNLLSNKIRIVKICKQVWRVIGLNLANPDNLYRKIVSSKTANTLHDKEYVDLGISAIHFTEATQAVKQSSSSQEQLTHCM